MSLTAEIYCRAFAFKPNYTNGSAPILLGNTGKLIEAVVKRCDGHCAKENVSDLAGIIRVIDSVNRLEELAISVKSDEISVPVLRRGFS